MPGALDDTVAPPRSRMRAELASLVRHPFWAPACRRIARAHRGDGRTVLVIPGFMTSDLLTWRLRRTLALAGYRAEGWGLGLNLGVRQGLLDALVRRLDALAATRGPVALVGWSLGGIYAREIAKLRPGAVERVVTLGSPFHGDPRTNNNAWRLYERINDHPVDRPPVDVDLPAKPPVPTIALWSARDGMVAPGASRGIAGEADRQVEVDCTHMDFCTNPKALAAILTAISAGTAPPPPPAP